MENLIQQLIKAFGWSIINSLWQSAIVYGVLFIVLFGFPKVAARHKHNLAFMSIVLMFISFAYNFAHQMILNRPQNYPTTQTHTAQVYPYISQIPESFASKAEQYFPVVVLFYGIGILLQLFVISKGYRQLATFKSNGLSEVPANWQKIFQKVSLRLNLKRKIRFHLSNLINVPLVIGYLKPIVLFPLAVVNQLDEDQVEAVLIHELSHIRRNDFFLNLIKTAIETILFFNPFVWMAGKFIHIEREHACDDLVLKLTGQPLNYAHALLKLELIKDKASPAFALAATGKTQNLYQRIKRITNMKTNYLNAKQQMAALTLGVACVCSIAWINPDKKTGSDHKTTILQTENIRSVGHQNNHANMYSDTTRKSKTKIICIDKNGKKTEYNSIKDLPDSLKDNFLYVEGLDKNKILKLNTGKNYYYADSADYASIYKEFASPEAQAKWKKFGEDIAKQYASPEAQAKWKKFGEDIAKQYASPEAQAKWEKFGEDIAKQYSSPEAQAKWKKFGEDIAKQYASPEAQAKWEKLGKDISEQVKTPEFRAQLERITSDALKGVDIEKLSSLKSIQIDSLSGSHKLLSPNGSILIIDSKSNKIKQTEEYKKLKEKFDHDVLELKEKVELKEQKEKKQKDGAFNFTPVEGIIDNLLLANGKIKLVKKNIQPINYTHAVIKYYGDNLSQPDKKLGIVPAN
ncbi:M56 family metallopeptidase [Pedobacter sp. AW1-32]|uniref:M56 family metallopeptidase n=1 Tax=Pedobacter sp. AW1-32 TaxID=3383026 RepID=UPI003FEE6217